MFSSSLAIKGNLLSSNEFILHILVGLDDSYKSLITNVLNKFEKKNTIVELFSMLLSHYTT